MTKIAAAAIVMSTKSQNHCRNPISCFFLSQSTRENVERENKGRQKERQTELFLPCYCQLVQVNDRPPFARAGRWEGPQSVWRSPVFETQEKVSPNFEEETE